MKTWIAFLVAASLNATAAAAQCCGDCNADGEVRIDELLTAVNHNLTGCEAGLSPIVGLHGVALPFLTGVLSNDATDGSIRLTLQTDWAGHDASVATLFDVHTASSFANRVELIKVEEFLLFIVTESSGREVNIGVRNTAWQPGVHTIAASWGQGTMRLAVDGTPAGQATVGAVLLASGAEVRIGSETLPGTIFRDVVFEAARR
jgi:hypothetical protein